MCRKKSKMRLKVHKMLKGVTNSTLLHPKRQYMNIERSDTKVYGGGVKSASAGDPVRRVTDKLKHLKIKTSKPMTKAYISFD